MTSPSGTATGTAVTFTIAFAGPASTTACNGANWTSNGTHTFNLLLTPSNPNSPVVSVPITLSIVTTSPLTVVPQSGPTFSLTYQKNSGIVQSQAGYLTSNTPNVFFGVNTNNVSWLSVSPASGTGNASNTTVRFSTTTSANSLPPGTYTGVVYFTVSGYADKPVTITLLVTNAPATLSVTTAAGAGATTVNLTYVLGGAYPTTTITVLSTDSPIAYTTKSAGPLAPIIQPNEATGLAYSFGTNVGISFNQLLYATLAPGSTLSGTVTFTWGPVSTPSNTVVTINLHVASASALLSSIFPASIPTATTGTATITLNGTGFVNSSDNTAATRVGIVSNGALNTDNNLSWVVNSPTNITLTITVPTSSDCPNIPMSPTVLCNGVIGGPVYLGVVNGTQNLSPTGTATLVVGSYPIILGVTSSSSFTETGAGNLQTFAPCDMISIFGANFCSQGNVATNCAGGANPTILPGVPTAFPDLIYPTSLTPDTNSLAPRLLTVTLHPHGLLSPSWPAPLLFATNGQINALVPAAVGVSPYVGTGTVDIIVTFGAQSSAAFNVSIAASDPGMFTIGSSGQGPAAALSFPSYSLVSATHPALMRSGVATSDTIQLYVTGLGLPPSSWNATTTGSNTPITNCVAAVTGTGNYMSQLQAAIGALPVLTNIDGAVVQSALIASNDFPPCLTTQPTVTIGGVAASAGAVTYAGFVDDTVAGLYQINVQLPPTTGGPFYPNWPATTNPIATLSAAATLPITFTVGTTPSQSGVTLQVAPALLMTAPANLTTLGVGQAYTGTVGAAQVPNSPVTFALAPSSGPLPTGLDLNVNTGVISGEPAVNTAGNYPITVIATDTSTPPVTGSVGFTMNVAGGLYVSFTVPAMEPTPFVVNGTFGSAALSPVLGAGTIVATGGKAPYTYALTTTAAAGMVFTPSPPSLVIATPATLLGGTYPITITATDGSAAAVQGTLNFPVVQALSGGVGSAVQTVSHASHSVISTLTGVLGVAAVTWAPDAATALLGFQIEGGNTVTAYNATGALVNASATFIATGTTTPTGATLPGTMSVTLTGITVN